MPSVADQPALGTGHRRWVFPLAVAGLFLVTLLPRVLWHLPWRDEWQTWLLCAASPDLPSLLHNRRYDGHPLLWYLLVWPLTSAGRSIVSMQVLHAAIATAAVWFVAAFAPWPRWVRIGVCFSYFMAYEYAVISRNYAAGVLLLAVSLAVYARSPARQIVAAVLLAIASQASLPSALVAAATGLAMMLDAMLARCPGVADAHSAASDASSPRRSGKSPSINPAAVVAGLIVLAGVVFAAVSARPAGPTRLSGGVTLRLDSVRLTHTAATVWQSAVPIPAIQPQFWNTNLLDPAVPVDAPLGVVRDTTTLSPAIAWQAALGLTILLTAVWMLRGHRPAMVGWLVGSAVLLGFTDAAYFGFLRHHGQLMVLLAAMAWLAAGAGRERRRRNAPTSAESATTRSTPGAADVAATPTGRWAKSASEPVGLRVHAGGKADLGEMDLAGPSGPHPRLVMILTAGLLGAQVVGMLAASVLERGLPFSGSAEAAGVIRDQFPPGTPVVADPAHIATPLAGQLGRRVFRPESSDEGDFVIWDDTRPAEYPQVMAAAASLAARTQRDVALAVNYLLPATPGFEPLVTVQRSVVSDEVYVIYRVRPSADGSAPTIP